MPETRPTAGRLRRLAARGVLDEHALERGFYLTGHLPRAAAWKRALDYSLLVLGTAFVLSGLFFFFAYNWFDLPRFAKFGLVDGLLIAAVGGAAYRGLDDLAGRIALTAAAVLVGLHLAVFGQIYQTGADAYTLFLTWAVLIVGWAWIGRYAPLWFLLLALLNLSLFLYAEQVRGGAGTGTLELLFLLDAGALAAGEVADRRGIAGSHRRWMPRLIALAMTGWILTPVLELIFTEGETPSLLLFLALPLYLGFLAVMGYVYTRRLRDLFMPTLCAFSLITVVTSTLARMMDLDEIGPYLLLSLATIGQAALAVQGLRRIARSWEEDADA